MTSAIADEPCRTLMLTSKALQWLKRDNQPLAQKLYRFLLSSDTGPNRRAKP